MDSIGIEVDPGGPLMHRTGVFRSSATTSGTVMLDAVAKCERRSDRRASRKRSRRAAQVRASERPAVALFDGCWSLADGSRDSSSSLPASGRAADGRRHTVSFAPGWPASHAADRRRPHRILQVRRRKSSRRFERCCPFMKATRLTPKGFAESSPPRRRSTNISSRRSIRQG